MLERTHESGVNANQKHARNKALIYNESLLLKYEHMEVAV